MKWIKKLFRRKGIRIPHSLFGELRFVPPRKTTPGFWEGEMIIMNMSEGLRLEIIAPISGPVQKQEEFLRSVVENFEMLIKAIHPFMKAAFEDAFGKAYPESFKDEFSWSNLTIPEAGERTNAWDLSFECKTSSKHLFTVYFDNGAPVQATIQK
ncbi:MAG: hypothetical protein ACRBF0_16165 [Calditrichia bacterium]